MNAGSEPSHRESPGKWRWPIALVLVTLVITGGIVVIIRSCLHAPADTIKAAGDAAAKIAAKFNQGVINKTFQESLPQLSSDPGGRLELASLSATETITQSDTLITAWGQLNLGSTVTEIKIPVTYRYYIRLHDSWKLDVTSNNCIVHAPRIHPTLPPAIDTSRMEKKSSEGWGRFNATEQMDELERGLTPTLAIYSSDPRHMALVREECRKNVAQFIRDWLLKEQQWRDDRFTSIKVVFADEAQTNIITLPPTLEFKAR